MTFKIERDGTSREVVMGEVDGRPVALVLEHVMLDRAHGHVWLTNDARNVLYRPSLYEAGMPAWLEKERPSAAPDIFSGEPDG